MYLKKIAASKDLCKKLSKLGLKPNGNNPALWHVENIQHRVVENGSFCLHDYPLSCWPAWTKGELDVMIGPDIDKPDLPREWERKKHESPNLFICYYPFRRLFDNGADASAWMLCHAIEDGLVSPYDAMERYNKHFNND